MGLRTAGGKLTIPVTEPWSDAPAMPLPRSSHNWNTLFMGPNAVADAIAQKYSATKSQVFDHVSEQPVRCPHLWANHKGAESREGALCWGGGELGVWVEQQRGPGDRSGGRGKGTPERGLGLLTYSERRGSQSRHLSRVGEVRRWVLSMQGSCPGCWELGGLANHLPNSQYGLSLSLIPQETKGSVAVRVALGETQLVQEVRRFLIDNGVSLDSFSQVGSYSPAQLLRPPGPGELSGQGCAVGFQDQPARVTIVVNFSL